MHGLWLVSYIALWVVMLLMVVLVLGLARELGTIHRRFGAPGALLTEGGLDIGAGSPDFKATEIPSGHEVSFHAGGKEALLVFLAPGCGPCQSLLSQVAGGWDEWRHRAQIHIVCEGDETAVRAFAQDTQARTPLLADPLARIRGEFGNPPTPFAFLIDKGGAVRLKGIVNSRDEIDRMLEGQAHVLGGREAVAVPARG